VDYTGCLSSSATARHSPIPPGLGNRGATQPRIGAALRHASALLQDEGDNRRAILLVTDGAPADVDVFDPEYLTEDARVAVMQARVAGVRGFLHCCGCPGRSLCSPNIWMAGLLHCRERFVPAHATATGLCQTGQRMKQSPTALPRDLLSR